MCNSLGTGLEDSLDVSNMRMILSLSYYDMPSHKIDKVRFIEMWIADGFVQRGKQGQSLFEAGEIYFNDLINRSIIHTIDGHLARYPWGPEARPILARPEHGTGPNIIGLGPARAR